MKNLLFLLLIIGFTACSKDRGPYKDTEAESRRMREFKNRLKIKKVDTVKIKSNERYYYGKEH